MTSQNRRYAQNPFDNTPPIPSASWTLSASYDLQSDWLRYMQNPGTVQATQVYHVFGIRTPQSLLQFSCWPENGGHPPRNRGQATPATKQNLLKSAGEPEVRDADSAPCVNAITPPNGCDPNIQPSNKESLTCRRTEMYLTELVLFETCFKLHSRWVVIKTIQHAITAPCCPNKHSRRS